jgi:hypothetical protein
VNHVGDSYRRSVSSAIRTEQIIGRNDIKSRAGSFTLCVRSVRHVADDAADEVMRATCLNTVKLSYFFDDEDRKGVRPFPLPRADCRFLRITVLPFFQLFTDRSIFVERMGFARNVTHNTRFPWQGRNGGAVVDASSDLIGISISPISPPSQLADRARICKSFLDAV